MHGAQSIEKGESGISSDDDGRLHHEQNGNGFVDAERGGQRVGAIYTEWLACNATALAQEEGKPRPRGLGGGSIRPALANV
ncbi:hypothetical protein PG991_000178 [Apiospora marii]|uniref:Uncharacterized protein n=1 Tax=Apiospora marii TaxID=335849 RepID=A0ABR1T1C9_9PEZI